MSNTQLKIERGEMKTELGQRRMQEQQSSVRSGKESSILVHLVTAGSFSYCSKNMFEEHICALWGKLFFINKVTFPWEYLQGPALLTCT